MVKGRILFVNQEMKPYLGKSELAKFSRKLPQKVQESGKEIRIFMPKFGNINERKNQLHEVIRLSGMNLIIENSDHPLIIKVASIQPARIQVYFIDNEDYFQRRFDILDDRKNLFTDNDERAIFYARGIMETVKKLNWQPQILHCSGWFSSLVPFYVKRTDYKNNPLFADSKIVLTLVGDKYGGELSDEMWKKLKSDGGTAKDWKFYKEPSYTNLMMAAISNVDAIVIAEEDVNPELIEFARSTKKPIVEYAPMEEQFEAINQLYEEISIPIEE